ncbi:MAG TPA: cbb3-type cytochrome c oxidase N-terminal domain-containing protein [Chitinophagales bacterium]|nr:cbb3-type cytochrome c oxidase N-terminal domain-containing protein [Chitinophagales bacterium]
MKFKSFKKISGFVLAMLLALPTIAQEAAQELPPTEFFSINTDTLLMMFAVFLTLPIYFLARLVIFSVKINIDKKSKAAGVLGLILLSASTANASSMSDFNYVTWMLIIIILIELLIIGILAYNVTNLLNWFSGAKAIADHEGAKAKTNWIVDMWTKMNKLRPMEEESELETGHVYDGIKELDNVTPPWFTFGFLASIAIAIIYMWVYHVSKSAPMQIEEYNIEMAKAEEAHNEYLKTQASAVDENSVIFLTDASSIANGKKLYEANCFACHKADGGGSVGPNLTDAYWLHGNTAGDIFKIIKYGVLEKGMTAWADVLSPVQISEVVSFIHSIQGSNPPDAKEPQGELYESADTTATADILAEEVAEV